MRQCKTFKLIPWVHLLNIEFKSQRLWLEGQRSTFLKITFSFQICTINISYVHLLGDRGLALVAACNTDIKVCLYCIIPLICNSSFLSFWILLLKTTQESGTMLREDESRPWIFSNISVISLFLYYILFPGLDLNNEEFFEDVPSLQPTSNQNYVPDAVLPPGDPWLHSGPSRAALSLPSCLCLCGDLGSGLSGSLGEEQIGEMKVYAKCHLQQGVMFGPFVGEVCKGQMPANLKYAWAVSEMNDRFCSHSIV